MRNVLMACLGAAALSLMAGCSGDGGSSSGGGSGATGGGSGATGGGSGATGGGSGATGGGSGATGGGSGATGGGSGTGGGTGTGGGFAGVQLPKPDRSTSINLTTDDKILLVTNEDNDSLSIFTTSGANATTITKAGSSIAFASGSRPVSVAIHPDNKTAFVVLRHAQKLVKITGIDTITPGMGTALSVGSEPTGVALTPTGKYAVVANFGDDFVTIVDTATMTEYGKVQVGAGPRAVAITNSNTGNDDAERAYVTLFYGAPNANGEVKDNGRTGKVIEVNIGAKTKGATIDLAPIADSAYGTFQAADGGGVDTVTAGCAPNQLAGITIGSNKAYVVHTCASPQGPVNPFTNVQSAVSVIDLSTNTEDTGITGTRSLNRLMRDQDKDSFVGVSQMLGVPVAIDFKQSGTNPLSVAYVVSQAADTVQRIAYSVTPISRNGSMYNILLGTNGAFGQIDIRAGVTKVPNGIVTGHVNQVAFVNNWLDHSVSVLDLNNQSALSAVDSDTKPSSGTAAAIFRGKKFYFTGTGRWSARGVSSCGACHPDGLSDNMTWAFAAGPRQTIPMDGTYSKSSPNTADGQRALNWTGIFDEVHDFENNTRGTSGGKGAIVTGNAPTDVRIDLTAPRNPDGGVAPLSPQMDHANLAGSTKAVVKFQSSLKDWDEVDEYSKVIKANRRPTALNSADVTAGQALFTAGNCAACHGGDKWTSSRVPYAPDVNPEKTGNSAADAGRTGYRTENTSVGTLSGIPNGTAVNPESNGSGKRVSVEVGAEQDGGNVGPERITCVLRKVGTFDQANPLERKANAATNAQGAGGFNPPSLLGLATSAPYFHRGQAATLQAVLTDSAFNTHLTSGAANFTLNATEAGQLAAFLLSIDDDQTKVTQPANTDVCTGY